MAPKNTMLGRGRAVRKICDIVEFEGGYYLAYTYRDGNDEEHDQSHSEALKHIEESGIFALDERPNHYSMGHIITPAEIIEAQGWAQMEVLIPIKLIGQLS